MQERQNPSQRGMVDGRSHRSQKLSETTFPELGSVHVSVESFAATCATHRLGNLSESEHPKQGHRALECLVGVGEDGARKRNTTAANMTSTKSKTKSNQRASGVWSTTFLG